MTPILRAAAVAAAAALVAACGTETASQAGAEPLPQDPHSFANTDEVILRHMALDLDVNFDERVLEGTARLEFQRVADGSTVVLDTRALEVESVAQLEENGSRRNVAFTLGDKDPIRGTPLVVELDGDGSGQAIVLEIAYRTDPRASGLQWLEARQTAGRRHPFLFSQSQAIHARSWVPIQDTPGVRLTYEAVLRVPEPLTAVMSAAPVMRENGEQRFAMAQAIPAYLLALAVGDLVFEPIGERTGVYAEKELIEAAASEFADTEKMLEIGEGLYGPYRWDRYDLLILPPSFPFGGMENPRVSFITPTVLAGDKSLVSLIAHELAHSWSGNLVTNATWRDAWLNEGFTTFFEARIMEALYGDRRRRLEDLLGYQSLLEDFSRLPAEEERLVGELGGVHPDDAFTQVPYEKGKLFLVFLEQRFGREAFDQFLRNYFDRFAFQSMTAEKFRAELEANLMAQQPDAVSADEIDAWLFGAGLPQNAVIPDSDVFVFVEEAIEEFSKDSTIAPNLATADWNVQEWLYFLNNLPKPLSKIQMAELDGAFDLTGSSNYEILAVWLEHAIRADYSPARPRLREFLVTVGRNKFLRPLYRALVATPEGIEFAEEMFEAAKPGYHPLSVTVVGEIIEDAKSG